MALFGSMRTRPTGATLASIFPPPQDRAASIAGVMPYFPTAEERATAIPGQITPGSVANGGTGSAQLGLGQHLAAALQGATPVPQAGMLSSAIGQAGQPSRTSGSPLADALNLPTRPIDMPNVPMPDVSTATASHPGFFHHGGLGEKILHGLGEFALQYQASQGDQGALMTLRGRMEQQRAAAEEAQWTRRHQTELSDARTTWEQQQEYKRAHPDDQFTSFMVAAGIDPHSPEGQRLYRQRAESMAAPPLMAVDGYDAQGNPQKTFVPRTAVGAGGQTQPTGPAVGTVRNGFRFMGGNPNDRGSWQAVGGAAPGAGVPFVM